MDVQNKRVLVVGLARSGLAVARALARRGAVVTVTDNKPPAEFREILPQLIKEKMGLELGSQRVETFLRHQLIVISPGVPWDLPQLASGAPADDSRLSGSRGRLLVSGWNPGGGYRIEWQDHHHLAARRHAQGLRVSDLCGWQHWKRLEFGGGPGAGRAPGLSPS